MPQLSSLAAVQLKEASVPSSQETVVHVPEATLQEVTLLPVQAPAGAPSEGLAALGTPVRPDADAEAPSEEAAVAVIPLPRSQEEIGQEPHVTQDVTQLEDVPQVVPCEVAKMEDVPYDAAEFTRLFRLHAGDAGFGLMKEEYLSDSNRQLIFVDLVRIAAGQGEGVRGKSRVSS